jgi:hypothetical protein
MDRGLRRLADPGAEADGGLIVLLAPTPTTPTTRVGVKGLDRPDVLVEIDAVAEI